MTRSVPTLDQLRRDATRLKKAWEAGAVHARQRIASHPPRADLSALKHADFLHVIARENFFESWPRLKLAAETEGLDRAARQQRLKVALYHGQTWVVEQLLADMPDLAKGAFGLSCALYDRAEVERMLAADPGLAIRPAGPRLPLLHLTFSRWHKVRPDLSEDMLAIAEALLAHGADVNAAVCQPASWKRSARVTWSSPRMKSPLSRTPWDGGALPVKMVECDGMVSGQVLYARLNTVPSDAIVSYAGVWAPR